MHADPQELAEQVRRAVIAAGLRAYDDAYMRGLCAEGAWEVAVGTMRELDLSRVLTNPSFPAED